MPVYHFTLHAFGTWPPDHPKGYIKRNHSWQPTNPSLAERYRQGMREDPAHFTTGIQQHALETLRVSEQLQAFTLYGFAGEVTHLHAIAGWTDQRAADAVCKQLKTSISRALTKHFGKRKWLAKNAGLTAVRDHNHLYQLVCIYLPKHSGIVWQPQRADLEKR